MLVGQCCPLPCRQPQPNGVWEEAKDGRIADLLILVRQFEGFLRLWVANRRPLPWNRDGGRVGGNSRWRMRAPWRERKHQGLLGPSCRMRHLILLDRTRSQQGEARELWEKPSLTRDSKKESPLQTLEAQIPG